MRSIPAPAGEPTPRVFATTAVGGLSRACGGTRLSLGLGLGDGVKGLSRACGGTSHSSPATGVGMGLSPRLRGNLPPPTQGEAPSRSIPAPAGEPELTRNRGAPGAVYPRACGGTFVITDVNEAPRVYPRACGEPGASCSSRCIRRVYPRACGGTADHAADTMRYGGLSPRLRGNLDHDEHGQNLERSIPAPAGNRHRCHQPEL